MSAPTLSFNDYSMSLPTCDDYLHSPEPLFLEKEEPGREEVVLQWDAAHNPAVSFEKEVSVSLPDTLKKITAKKDVQKKLLDNNNELLQKLALIINHFHNTESVSYSVLPNSVSLKNKISSDSFAEWLKRASLVFLVKKGCHTFKVTLISFELPNVNYELSS